MPELVTCPSCGFKTQMAEGLLGRRVRCPGCDNRFVAAADPEPPAETHRPAPPSRPVLPGRPPLADEDYTEDQTLPFCPGCGKRVRWEALRCPYCAEELEPESEFDRACHRVTRSLHTPMRRDSVPHRGKLISRLGNVSLIVGAASLCTCGLGFLAALPLGITAWVMANHDLEQMRTGAMDARGRPETESGRIGAVVGIVLSMLFACFYALMYAGKF
jgi:hypothetical protein